MCTRRRWPQPRRKLPRPSLPTRKPARPRLAAPKRRAPEILARLEAAYPDARCALDHADALQLLVATILSAQCTDERVNMVTPELFRRYPDAHALAEADPLEVEDVIRSTGFFRQKAKNIQGAARRIVAEFGGRVPETMEELITLPGVARKTANVVLGVAFGKAAGVVVDTHVRRISGRLGLTQHTDPVKIERDLMAVLPKTLWIQTGHLVIAHGRQICQARRPLCAVCPVADLCPSAS